VTTQEKWAALEKKNRVHCAMRAYLKSARGLSDEEITYLARTGFDIQKRQREHARTDPIIQRAIGRSVKDFRDIFKAAVKPPRFLQGGVYGITALMTLPGVPSPVVAKFTESPSTAECTKDVSRMVCRTVGGKRCGDYVWTGNTRADREIAIHGFVSAVEEMGASPHFLHTYLGAPIELQQRVSIQQVAKWLGAPAAKVKKYGASGIRTLNVSVLEYGGSPMPDLIKKIISKHSVPTCVSMMRSAMAQILQAITTMVAVGNLHHNDLHVENILGSITATPFLYYQVILTSRKGRGGASTSVEEAERRARANKAGVVSRLFKVPTHGFMWRVIDFGHATSTDLFGEDDHAIMARSAFGGPMWPGAVDRSAKTMPLELFDAARFLDNVTSEVSCLPREAKGILRKDIDGVITGAERMAKQLRDTLPLSAVQRLQELTTEDLGTSARLRKVKEEIAKLRAASADHGLMVETFMAAAQRFGFEVNDEDVRTEMTEENTYVLSM